MTAEERAAEEKRNESATMFLPLHQVSPHLGANMESAYPSLRLGLGPGLGLILNPRLSLSQGLSILTVALSLTTICDNSALGL